jgi:hypothetical protein
MQPDQVHDTEVGQPELIESKMLQVIAGTAEYAQWLKNLLASNDRALLYYC